MADIFDEVNEDLRADRAHAFLRRYGMMIAAAAGLAVVATGGWEAWTWWRGKQDSSVAMEFLAAMRLADAAGPVQALNRPEAITAFEQVVARAPEGYRTLARLRVAALKADGGDIQGASAAWEQVAADPSADPLLRDLASLMWVQHQIDTGGPGVLEARLRPLAAADNPFRFLAAEAQGLLDLREGRTDAAKVSFRTLSGDPAAPQGVRRRAAGLLDRLGG